MRLPQPAHPTAWIAGVAATLALAALAIHAAQHDGTPRDTAAPDPLIVQRIRAFEQGTGRAADPPIALADPQGRAVYYFIGPCCDHFNRLYDADGRFICAPSGGFTGAGDGQCPGWAHDERTWRQVRRAPAPAQQPSAPR